MDRLRCFACVATLLPACGEFVGADTDQGDAAASGSTSIADSTGSPTSTTNDATSTLDPATTDDTSATTEVGSSSGEGQTASDAATSSSESGALCPGETLCGDACVDLETDVDHCGRCSNPCSEDNAMAECVQGMCVLTCTQGFDDCDEDVGTGCEQSLQTPLHCGACDTPEDPEICDGLANDCSPDTASDAGCPAGITVEGGGIGAHALFGNESGGEAFDDVCPAGAALVGFVGNAGGNIDRISGRCAPLELEVDLDSTPYGYQVTAGAVTDLPVRGGNLTAPYEIACPPDAFVVGLSGEASGGGLHDLTIHCAQMLVSGAPGSFAVSYGPVTTDTVNGLSSGDAFSDQLAEPAIVDRYRGRDGLWVDAIGSGEATVALQLIE